MVTGAAQGIGEQTARRISAEGGTLVLADRSELVKELADELAPQGPGHWRSPPTSNTRRAPNQLYDRRFRRSAASTC